MDAARRAAPKHDPRVAIHGSGRPLVLVPGLDGTGLLFYRQVPLLARRHRVVTYALREEAPGMDALVEQLRRVVDLAAPEGERVTIVGESFGGALALSFALAHPDRVAAVVVLNSFARFLPQLRLHLAIAGMRVVPWGAMALARRLTAFRLHSPHTHRAEIRTFLELTRLTTRRGYLSRLRILREYDVRGRLAELRVPSLFLASDRDHLVPSVREAAWMAARAPDARLRVLAGHGHICLIAPDVDLDEILATWEAERRESVLDDAAPPAGSAGPCTSGT